MANERKHHALQLLAVIGGVFGMLLLYVLSIIPMTEMCLQEQISDTTFRRIYYPIVWLCEHSKVVARMFGERTEGGGDTLSPSSDVVATHDGQIGSPALLTERRGALGDVLIGGGMIDWDRLPDGKVCITEIRLPASMRQEVGRLGRLFPDAKVVVEDYLSGRP